MKKVLIISPHFPPSNLAAVHRSRLFARHLPAYGWTPIILMVDEKYYEEEPDYDLMKLLPEDLRLEKVKALPVTKPRLIGDIGLRSFLQITRKAIKLVKQEKIDFLYIPIPSFYMALVGRLVNARTGITYGIDYIDPWVHVFAGSDKMFSRHWWSTKVASLLEPFAVKYASLITGVSPEYYKGVAERNPHLKKDAIFAAMPYGGEKSDHQKVAELELMPYLFSKKEGQIQLVYAGAMLPKSYELLERIFKVINDSPHIFNKIEFHFIGTGKTPSDPNGYNIKLLAEKYDLWQKQVYEYPKRIPYLDVLIHLKASDGIFILGSTEQHYTPSKVYQAVLSEKPILAVLHAASSACEVIRDSEAGTVLDFNGIQEIDKVSREFLPIFSAYLDFIKNYDYKMVKQGEFERYSAQAVTSVLASALNSIVI